MKALYKLGVGRYEFRDIPEPHITAPDEVKIKVAYCTISSDETRDLGAEDLFSQEQLIGREMSGVVVDAGEEAVRHGFSVGDHVGGLPVLSCGRCRMCRSNRPHQCLEIKRTFGTMCEYIVWKYSQLVVLPREFPLQVGCLIDPLATVLQALDKADICIGDYVAVFGAGFSGLMFLQMAKHRGAAHVTVVEPLASRRRLALEFGADNVVDPFCPDIQIQLSDITEFTGFDKIFETSGDFDALSLASRCLTRGGTLLSSTYYPTRTAKMQLNMLQIYLDSLTICSSFLSVSKMDTASQMLSRLRCEELITLEVPFDRADVAYHLAKEKQHIKIVVKLSE